ncbi:MAG: HAMP domain-containing sensor histidine kinase [Acidobacteriota bacterium]
MGSAHPHPASDRPRFRRLSVRGPAILFSVVLALIVLLTVLWNVVLVQDYQKIKALAVQEPTFHWAYIALGTALFLAIIVLSSILGAQLLSHIRWSQRQSNFIASVSHELNSPLSAIKLFAQTLRNPGLTDDERRNFVEKILFDVARLQRLIANILRAAEADNRGDVLPVLPQPIDLIAYLDTYLDDARQLHADAALETSLSWNDAIEPPLIASLDPMMFRQVLDNLIDNTVRYRGAEPARLRVRVSASSTVLTVALRDAGVGIDANDLPRLFDRFYRGEAAVSTRARKGTGIGLYVVRSIMRAHGGQIAVHSDGPGQGTTFFLSLPRHSAAADAASTAATPDAAPPAMSAAAVPDTAVRVPLTPIRRPSA